MSVLIGCEEFVPRQVRGKVKRTSGPVQQGERGSVFIHIEEVAGKLKGTEVALTFQVDNSLFARMAQPGDIVFMEWIPRDCFRGDEGILFVVPRRFHLSRLVHSAFGSGFEKPDWFAGR